eukprot:TRINITY_DN1436_c0_g1_i5.p1 TRINITY_DN1436_c0_g1~~TRINITY_DN1436_c0_g1_i5.p1  ORF type:complete len:262 (+),score=18.80 TRINITY_DN1436_c0_g1_i5:115-900(+)
MNVKQIVSGGRKYFVLVEGRDDIKQKIKLSSVTDGQTYQLRSRKNFILFYFTPIIKKMFQFIVIFIGFCFQSVVCLDMSNYIRVTSEYSYLVPDYDFSKKDFLKDGPYAPFDKAIIYSWDDENEYYSCQSVARNTTAGAAYCEKWSADEQSGGASSFSGYEREKGVCNCLENSMGPHYCTYWFCTQQEIEVAVRSTGDEGYTRSVSRDTEYTDCVCRYESLNGKYCQQWWCLETGKDGNTDRKSTRLNSSHEIPSRMPSSA